MRHPTDARPTGQWFLSADGHRWWFDSGALALDFTSAQLRTLESAADAVVGSRAADPNWVSQGRE